ncbi:hypothetical protein BaRGS_00029577 [Batillaria attramentaria]|uniref:Transthyretin/hydroxyisourate hydrolase domain-containing protein n=1 Tax=Batillaria attramentaria TaxID=370345 RepID=A0ABD0JXJ0_9CAEN
MAGGAPRAPLTVRVHDSARGCAARGVPVFLAMRTDPCETWDPVEEGVTNAEGAAAMLYHVTLPQSATYRLEIDCATYFAASGQDACCQRIETTFRLAGPDKQRQVSVHLSPAGYSLHLGC